MVHSTQELLELMTRPSAALIEDIRKLDGDIMILGAGGKVGPTMAILAKRAVDAAGTDTTVYAVSLFDYPDAAASMQEAGVHVIEADIADPAALAALPDAKNIIYMVGKKFGTSDNQPLTWQVNVTLPYLVAQRFPAARIVAFSTGNYYGVVPVVSGGSCESDIPSPVGEYAQSCMGRERIFTYCSKANNTPMVMFRLNYAIELRYGVLYDIAKAIAEGRPVDLTPSVFNCIWQGDVCEYAIRSLFLATVPPRPLNVSSPEAFSVRWVAHELAKRLGKPVTFVGEERSSAMFINCQNMVKLLGYPRRGILEMMDMVAEWVLSGGQSITAPTHFESTDGKF